MRDTYGYIDPACPINWAHPLNRGLRAWWYIPRNPGWWGGEKLRDLCIRSPGTLNGGVLWRGGMGGACEFDGSNDYVSISNGPSLTGPCSVFAWVKPIGFGAPGAKWIVAEGDGGSDAYLLEWNATAAKASFAWAGAAYRLTGATDLVVGKWAHIGGSRGGSTGAWNASVWYNGVSDASASAIATNPNTAAGVSIGRLGSASVGYANGLIRDVRLYDREVRAAEAAALYYQSRTGNIDLLNWLPAARSSEQAVAVGHPTMRRWGGVPGMVGAGRIGRSW